MKEQNATAEQNDHITLNIGEHEISFAPTIKDYNDLQNDFMPNNKIAPLKNYLRRTVIREHRALLDSLLDKPGMAAGIASALNAEFAPDVEITVKK